MAANATRGFRRRLLAAVAIGALASAVMVHAASALMYYRMTLIRLTAIDQQAVREGAAWLREDPPRAIRTAQLYALDHGIAAGEIGFIRTAPDGSSLGMGLNRKIPAYIAVLALGLPGRIVKVTAWAPWRDNQSPNSPDSHSLRVAKR